MTCLNPDRAQLQCLDAVAVSIPSPLTASAPETAKKATPSTPATSTAPTQNAGTLNAMVASRCNRLDHSNNEQRKRYLDVHRTLATAICSGADQ